MAADERVDEIMGHVTHMIELLEAIKADMNAAGETEKQKSNPDTHKIAFYESQQKRASRLADLLDDEVSTQVYGLKNISGPIKYLQEE